MLPMFRGLDLLNEQAWYYRVMEYYSGQKLDMAWFILAILYEEKVLKHRLPKRDHVAACHILLNCLILTLGLFREEPLL